MLVHTHYKQFYQTVYLMWPSWADLAVCTVILMVVGSETVITICMKNNSIPILSQFLDKEQWYLFYGFTNDHLTKNPCKSIQTLQI